jgi:branched-chain amino acid transport system substrate-binding protein
VLKKGKNRKLNRRRFLKTTGLLAGATVLSPVLPAQIQAKSLIGAAPAPPVDLPILLKPAKISVLLPRSRNDALESKSFMAGLQLQLKAGSNAGRVDLSSETVRSSFNALEDKFEKITHTQESHPQLVIGVTNPAHSYLSRVAVETRQTQTAFLGVGLGENVPRVEAGINTYRQNIAHLSFMSTEANWLLGYWAATNIGKKVALATSFYDSGFDLLFAFQQGFESGGGQVVGRLITHTGFGHNSLKMVSELVELVARSQPDLVFGSYYGQAAREFLAAYAQAGLAGKLPLVGSSFLVMAAPNDSEYAFPGIVTASSWADTENPQNVAFRAAYLKQTARPPDVFALLGYEAALMATAYLNSGSFSFAELKISSPRGELTPNPFGQFGPISYGLYQTQLSGDRLVNVVHQQLSLPESAYSNLSFLQTQLKSGWLNPYMF